MSGKQEHNHYFKSVEGLTHVDIYRVLHLFNVTDPCIQHAVKKLLVAGARGDKAVVSNRVRDIKEAIDSLQRWQEMRHEEETVISRPLEMNTSSPPPPPYPWMPPAQFQPPISCQHEDICKYRGVCSRPDSEMRCATVTDWEEGNAKQA